MKLSRSFFMFWLCCIYLDDVEGQGDRDQIRCVDNFNCHRPETEISLFGTKIIQRRENWSSGGESLAVDESANLPRYTPPVYVFSIRSDRFSKLLDSIKNIPTSLTHQEASSTGWIMYGLDGEAPAVVVYSDEHGVMHKALDDDIVCDTHQPSGGYPENKKGGECKSTRSITMMD